VLLKYELYGIGHIAQQMKTIGDLHSIGRAVPCTFSVGTSTIATNHGYTRMRLQPLAQGGSLAIRQQGNRQTAFHVDQHRAVALPFAVRPVINAYDARRW
jgi:hypothetical protein